MNKEFQFAVADYDAQTHQMRCSVCGKAMRDEDALVRFNRKWVCELCVTKSLKQWHNGESCTSKCSGGRFTVQFGSPLTPKAEACFPCFLSGVIKEACKQ